MHPLRVNPIGVFGCLVVSVLSETHQTKRPKLCSSQIWYAGSADVCHLVALSVPLVCFTLADDIIPKEAGSVWRCDYPFLCICTVI